VGGDGDAPNPRRGGLALRLQKSRNIPEQRLQRPGFEFQPAAPGVGGVPGALRHDQNGIEAARRELASKVELLENPRHVVQMTVEMDHEVDLR
jgi:hypothetical protein